MIDARERFQAAADLFLAARELPPERVAAFLESACGGDAELLRQVRDLLASSEDSNVFVTLAGQLRPAVDRLRGGVDSSTVGSSVLDTEPAAGVSASDLLEGRIGPYDLKERIGEGGFGQVWVAEQLEPVRRRVAIKVIKPGMDSREVLSRFDIERQALALMDHPHIAKVLDAGMTERGRPYFVMEYVPGLSITSFCDTVRLRVNDRLKLFCDVCRAVQHAHLRGVIHRDLKPSNVLVTTVDGQPTPKVIDFGVAKATAARLTGGSLYTEMGRIIGTPAYMSPEQAGSAGIDIDTRSDVYSLGVILYQLLTGTTPLDEKVLRDAGFDGIARMIREIDPPRPSTRFSTMLSEPATRGDVTPAQIAQLHGTDIRTLQRELRGELDWIVMKCLEKDRARRYESVNELASDIQRYLAGAPVTAAPPGVGYRLRKFVQRHRLLIGAAAAMFVTLLVGLGVSMYLFFQERDARRRAVAAEAEQTALRQQAEDSRVSEARQRRTAEQISIFLSEMLSAIQPQRARGNREITVAEALDEASARVQRGDFGAEPEVLAAIENVIGVTYRKVGKYDQALIHLSAALKLRRELFDDQHPDVATSKHELAGAHYEKGEYAAAEKLIAEALATREKLFGPESAEVAAAQHDLGQICLAVGRFDEAKRWEEAAQKSFRTAFGADYPGLSGPLDGLGGVAYQRGDYAAAETFWSQALEIRLKMFGESDSDVGSLYNNLATVRSSRGDYPGAIEFHRKALAIRRQILGPAHAEVAHSLRNLATCLSNLGNWDEAEGFYREAIQIQRVAIGPDHPQLASSLESLGTLLRSVGKAGEARDLMDQALEMRRRTLSPSHPAISQSMLYLGVIDLDEGDFAAARARFEEALPMRRQALGRDDVLVGELLVNLGRALAGQRELAQAEESLRAGIQCLRTVSSPRSPRVANGLHRLAGVLADKGDAEGAEAAFGEALNLFQAARMGEKREAVNCMTRIAGFHERRGELAEAEQLLRSALEILTRKFSADDAQVSETRAALDALHAAAPQSAPSP